MTGQRWVVDAAGGMLEKEDIKTFCNINIYYKKIRSRRSSKIVCKGDES